MNETPAQILNLEDAVNYIKSQYGDPKRWKVRQRGFIDWKFGELAEYKGFQAAVAYAESVRLWYDFEKYNNCLLEQTYAAFLEAEKTIHHADQKAPIPA